MSLTSKCKFNLYCDFFLQNRCACVTPIGLFENSKKLEQSVKNVLHTTMKNSQKVRSLGEISAKNFPWKRESSKQAAISKDANKSNLRVSCSEFDFCDKNDDDFVTEQRHQIIKSTKFLFFCSDFRSRSRNKSGCADRWEEWPGTRYPFEDLQALQ